MSYIYSFAGVTIVTLRSEVPVRTHPAVRPHRQELAARVLRQWLTWPSVTQTLERGKMATSAVMKGRGCSGDNDSSNIVAAAVSANASGGDVGVVGAAPPTSRTDLGVAGRQAELWGAGSPAPPPLSTENAAGTLPPGRILISQKGTRDFQRPPVVCPA